MRKKRGVRSGLPDLLVWHRGRSIGIELKSLFGRVSAAQRQVRDAMLKAGVQWWCCRTATAALTVLYRAGVPLRGWKPPPLEAWEEPVSDPDHMIWAPQVLAQWREDRARWRAAAKARRDDGANALAIGQRGPEPPRHQSQLEVSARTTEQRPQT